MMLASISGGAERRGRLPVAVSYCVPDFPDAVWSGFKNKALPLSFLSDEGPVKILRMKV